MGRGRYFTGLADAFGVHADRFWSDGVLVVPAIDRLGERRVTLYHVGALAVIWTDPDLADELSAWHRRSTTPTFEEFRAWAIDAGANMLGHGLEHLLTDSYRPVPWSPELTVLDGRSAAGVELVRTLLDECSDEDLDEAEFEIDALDPYLVGWVDAGRLLALAGGRPEPVRPDCMDIGVLVHPDERRHGHGAAVVAATAAEVIAAGHLPLYRCASTNVGSSRLCRSVGFELVLELEAFDWGSGPTEC